MKRWVLKLAAVLLSGALAVVGAAGIEPPAATAAPSSFSSLTGSGSTPSTASATASAPATATATAGARRAAIGRLYFAAFDRSADSAGLDYWYGVHSDGADLNRIAGFFVTSEEFLATYGNLDDHGLVDRIYRNVLKRPPDQPGLAYWVALLDDGYSPGTVLNGFAQSPEFVASTTPPFPTDVLMIGDSIFHGIFLLRIPVGTAELMFMTAEGRQAAALPGLIDTASSNGSLDRADLVVIHLGTNGWEPSYEAMFAAEVSRLAPTPVLVVNTEVARPYEGAANSALARVVDDQPHARLVDWNAAVATHPHWMRPDGVHPTAAGLENLAALIEAAVSR